MDCNQLFTGVRKALDQCGQLLDALAFSPTNLSAAERDRASCSLIALSERIALQSGLAFQEMSVAGEDGASGVLAVLEAHVSLAEQTLPAIAEAISASLTIRLDGAGAQQVTA